MLYKPMDEATILDILKKQEDILTPMVEKHQAIYEAQSCPTCGSGRIVEPCVQRMLANRNTMPRHLSRCPVCDCLIDPFSGIVLENGNKGKLEPVVPLIHVDD